MRFNVVIGMINVFYICVLSDWMFVDEKWCNVLVCLQLNGDPTADVSYDSPGRTSVPGSIIFTLNIVSMQRLQPKHIRLLNSLLV